MQKKELTLITRNIQSVFPSYVEDERLINYNYEEILERVKKCKDKPKFEELTKGLHEEQDTGVILKCDYCGNKELVFDTDEFLRKHDRCKSVDWLSRYVKKVKGEGITKTTYYEMSNEEFEKAYRPWMQHYLNSSKSDFLKKL